MIESAGPPFDPAHPQVAMVPSWLTTGKHKGPQGDLVIWTFRVPNTTLTLVLDKANAQKWIDQMQQEVDGMTNLVIAPTGSALPPMSHNTNGRPFG